MLSYVFFSGEFHVKINVHEFHIKYTMRNDIHVNFTCGHFAYVQYITLKNTVCIPILHKDQQENKNKTPRLTKILYSSKYM